MKVSIIIPAYNEAKIIRLVVEDLVKKYPEHEVLLVDDGSLDDTAEIALNAGAEVIRHAVNQGYGSSWKSGVRHAKGDILVFFDGGVRIFLERYLPPLVLLKVWSIGKQNKVPFCPPWNVLIIGCF